MLALIVHLFSLAALFLLLTSAFVAAAQVVVYAGAVMVLYVFVVAYVGGGGESAWEPIPGQRFLAPLLAVALFVELSIAVLGSALRRSKPTAPTSPAGFGNPAAIGRLLLEKFLLALRGPLDPAAARRGRRHRPGRASVGKSRRSRRRAKHCRVRRRRLTRMNIDWYIVLVVPAVRDRRHRHPDPPQPDGDPALPRADAERRQPRPGRLQPHGRQPAGPGLRDRS